MRPLVRYLKARYLPCWHALAVRRCFHNRSLVLAIYSPRFNETLDTRALFTGSQAYRLINNGDLRARYLELLRSHDEMTKNDRTTIFATIDMLVDTASGFPDRTTIELIFNLWAAVFSKRAVGEVAGLQNDLAGIRDKVTHLCINTRNYHIYEKYLKKNISWADHLAQTFQLSYKHGKLVLNRSGVMAFVGNEEVAIETRRKFLSQLIHAGVLNTTDNNERFFFYEVFVEMAEVLGDNSFEFLLPEYGVYTRILRLMGTPHKMPFLEHMARISALFTTETQKNSFITLCMNALRSVAPNSTLNLWKYKLEACAERNMSYRTVLHHRDLTNAMNALCELNLHSEAIALYSNYPDIHNEDQIEVMLRISEETQNWLLLQSQFEDMYGKGRLPYIEHYVVVMRALSREGYRDQVDLLYEQLQKRNLQPNEFIFAALIASRLYWNDISGAKECFQQYLEYVADKTKSARLYSLMFKVHIRSGDLDAVMAFLRETAQLQRETGLDLVSDETVATLIAFASRNYGLREIEDMMTIARDLNIVGHSTYVSLANAYINLDQFERADKMVYLSHQESDVPFTNPDSYAVQLRNYAKWLVNTPRGDLKEFLAMKSSFIAQMVVVKNNEVVSIHGGSPLIYTEVIKYYLLRKQIADVSEVLSIAKQNGVLAEVHFLPILRHLSREKTYEAYTEILTMYRRMAKERIKVTTATYVYLMQALNFLDSQQNANGVNSTKLLANVMEMNGMRIDGRSKDPEADHSKKPTSANVLASSIDLCKIISSYVDAFLDKQHSQLLVNFFDQIKGMLGHRHLHRFRFTVYMEMSKIYRLQDHDDLARQLLESGLDDLRKISRKYAAEYPYRNDSSDGRTGTREDSTDNSTSNKAVLTEKSTEDYTGKNDSLGSTDSHDSSTSDSNSSGIVIPSSLTIVYRQLSAMLLHLNGDNSGILTKIDNDMMPLTGPQYNAVIADVLKKHVDDKTFLQIMKITEDHLVAGNWVEVRIMRIYQQLYHLAYEHIRNVQGQRTVDKQYKLLNVYYNVENQTYGPRKGSAMTRFTTLFNESRSIINAHKWTVDRVFADIPGFFNPEKRILSRNKLSPVNSHRLWLAMNWYADHDKHKAFALMDEFPQTVEFLMYNDTARVRMSYFREKVDAKIPKNPRESYEEKVKRTREVLNTMKRRSNFGR